MVFIEQLGIAVAMKQVTQAEWDRLMPKNPSEYKQFDLPVLQVTWFEAVEYCNKLSVQEGLVPVYTIGLGSWPDVSINYEASGYRLLTTEEWDFIAETTGLVNLDQSYFDWCNNIWIKPGTKDPFNRGLHGSPKRVLKSIATSSNGIPGNRYMHTGLRICSRRNFTYDKTNEL
jgi:hypothetical protein